jgi:hypothetical protein
MVVGGDDDGGGGGEQASNYIFAFLTADGQGAEGAEEAR